MLYNVIQCSMMTIEIFHRLQDSAEVHVTSQHKSYQFLAYPTDQSEA